jgi:hypothetical protein
MESETKSSLQLKKIFFTEHHQKANFFTSCTHFLVGVAKKGKVK